MVIALDNKLDKHFGADYVFISHDISKRFTEHRNNYSDTETYRIKEAVMKMEVDIMREFCEDNIKVYRQLSKITEDYKINYLESRILSMRNSIKILDKIKERR